MKRTILNPKGTVGQAVADYLELEVKEIEIHLDPKVPGTYAIRAEVWRDPDLEPDEFFFLVQRVALDKLTWEELEEVEFETWPPESGNLKFFT